MQNGNGKRLRAMRKARVRRNALCPYPKCSLTTRELAGLPATIQRHIHDLPELNPEVLHDLTFINQE